MQFSFMILEGRAGPLPPDPEISLNSADLSEPSLFSLLTSQPGDHSLEKKKKKSLLHLTGLCQESFTVSPRHCVSSSELLRCEHDWIAGGGGGHGHRRGCHVL